MKPKHSLWPLLTILVILNSVALNLRIASLDSSAVVYVDPLTNTVPPGQYFTIRINISNVVNLNFWDIKLQYNAEVLFTNGTLIEEGPFLASTGETTNFNKYIGPYYIQLGCMIMAPVGASGSGTLATITFLVQKKGSSSLDLYDTKLYDPTYPSPDSEITHAATDGYFIYVSDIAVTNVTISSTTASVGEPVYINATIKNKGNTTETFNVTAYYDSTPIRTQKVMDLNPGFSLAQSFTWNTSGSAAGTYVIKVSASIAEGETDTLNNEFVNGEVTLTTAPKAIFTFSPSKPIPGETVTFNASASFDPDGVIVSYKWDFGDNNITTITTPTITHAYSAPGNYTVTLIVTDDEGLIDTQAKTITVQEAPSNILLYTTALLIVIVIVAVIVVFAKARKPK